MHDLRGKAQHAGRSTLPARTLGRGDGWCSSKGLKRLTGLAENTADPNRSRGGRTMRSERSRRRRDHEIQMGSTGRREEQGKQKQVRGPRAPQSEQGRHLPGGGVPRGHGGCGARPKVPEEGLHAATRHQSLYVWRQRATKAGGSYKRQAPRLLWTQRPRA